MRQEELVEIIDNLRVLGSDVTQVEVKRSATALPKSVRETLSAFSNTSGGVIILGLDEVKGFATVGVDDAPKIAADLGSWCSTDMDPPLRPLIGIHQFEGHILVVAEVPAIDRSQKPAYYKGAGINQGSYVRVSDGDRKLTSYEVQMMLSSRGQPRDDEVLTEATLDDLDGEAARRFVARLRVRRPNAFQDLDDTGVLTRAKAVGTAPDGTLRPTLAGLLTLGTYPQYTYPQLMLTFVSYPTVDGADDTGGVRFLDNVAVEGSIPVMVRDALVTIRRNMSRRAVVAGAGRADVWEYPETAVREAVVNALAHRDLSPASFGSQVQVEMYPDRLLVRSPGGLFGPVTIDSLGEEGVSSSRNAVLLRLLEDVSLPGEDRTVCENRGSGIRAMIVALRSAGMSPPQFDDRISLFRVAFPNHALLGQDTVEWIRGLGEHGLTDSQCIGLAMLRDGQVLDNTSYRTATGLDSRVATQELGDLVARELVEQSGSRRWARYALTAPVRPATHQHGARRRPADRRAEILDALGDQTLARADIAAITGLSDQTVRRWLGILRSEGLVEIAEGRAPQSKLARYRRIGARLGIQQALDVEQSRAP